MAKKAKPVAMGKAAGMKFKKGDDVVVIAGRKNKKVNFQGARGAKEGGIVTQEAPIHVSNVALIDPDTKKPARAGYQVGDDARKIRVSRPSGKEI